jgi:hypothetical protein
VQLADQQRDPLGVTALAYVVDACHLRFAGEVRDLARLHALSKTSGLQVNDQLKSSRWIHAEPRSGRSANRDWKNAN